MSSSFPDWEQLVEPLAFTCRGKTYVLPELGITDTTRLNLALDPDASKDDQIPADEMEQMLLGDAAPQMRADNVPGWFFDRVFKTAVAEYSAGREVAKAIWSTGGSGPKAAAPTPAAEGSTPSPSTGEASTTPSPAPTPGTRTSRRKPQPSAPTAAAE